VFDQSVLCADTMAFLTQPRCYAGVRGRGGGPIRTSSKRANAVTVAVATPPGGRSSTGGNFWNTIAPKPPVAVPLPVAATGRNVNAASAAPVYNKVADLSGVKPGRSQAHEAASQLASLLRNDGMFYSDVTVASDGQSVEFAAIVDCYMGVVDGGDVERVHKHVAAALPAVASFARTKSGDARLKVSFPLPPRAISSAPLPPFSPLLGDTSLDVEDNSCAGLKFLLDQHVVHNRVLALMEKGSDDRSIFTGPHRLGKYYTGMRPLTEATIHRGTCTSSSPTPGAYAAAVEIAKQLWTQAPGIENNLLAAMRGKVQKLFSPDIGTFTFHPSGTDAESVPLLYAILQSRALAHRLGGESPGSIVSQGRVVSIVTCAAEVGSGTLDAARGCYFSSDTPLSAAAVNPGQRLPYLHRLANIQALAVQGRGEDGARAANMESDVLELARAKLDEDPTTVVVMHTVAGSKTGMFAPSEDVMETLVREYGKERVVGVLDACQMRHAPTLIPRWLESYGVVMITASKYYGGPSFAGGVLLSNDTVNRMQEALDSEGRGVQTVIAKALSAYLTSGEICTRMPALCGAFGETRYSNTGLVLRWAAGLYEMETLQSAIEAVGAAEAEERMRRWVVAVRGQVEELHPQLDLLPVEDYTDADYQFGRINSIVSVRVRNNVTGGYRSTEELKMVYSAMYNDVSAQLPESTSTEELALGAQCCLVGQPVPIPGNAVLRTCMGGPQMKRLLEAADFEAELSVMLLEDAVVLRKLALLGREFETLFPSAT